MGQFSILLLPLQSCCRAATSVWRLAPRPSPSPAISTPKTSITARGTAPTASASTPPTSATSRGSSSPASSTRPPSRPCTTRPRWERSWSSARLSFRGTATREFARRSSLWEVCLHIIGMLKPCRKTCLFCRLHFLYIRCISSPSTLY